MTLHRVRLKGTYFSTSEKCFIPVGAHWVPARAALQWPLDWDAADIEADFKKMRELGFNTVRFDLFWAWFEPLPGSFNPQAFHQFDHLIALAHQNDIYLHPTFFIGGEVGEAYWDVPWRHGRHPHADPEMLRLQTDHAAEFARRYRGEDSILAWDLTDEPPYWIAVQSTTDAMAINWTRLIAGAVRRHDPDHVLCVGTSQEDLNHGPFRPDQIADEVDFFSAHPYSIYALHLFPDPMLSERGTSCGAFQTALSGGAGRPVMIHELGASSAQYDPERVASFDQVTLYSSLAAGANGFLAWCFTDAAPETFRRAPYLRAPHETQFGVTTWDRQDRPSARVLRDFSAILAQLDLAGIEPAQGDAAAIVPYEWSKPHGDFARMGLEGTSAIPYVSTKDGDALAGQSTSEDGDANTWLMGALLSAFMLGRRAGLKVDLPREHGDWRSYPILFLPSPLTSTEHNLAHVHTTFWEAVRDYVESGGVVYASLCADAAIPEMAGLFGASLADHAPVDEVVLTTTAPLGGLEPGFRLRYQAERGNPRHWAATLNLAGGQVIATDQGGMPALVANQLGKGKTLLSAYPIEAYLAAAPAAFEGDENSHRLYSALREWAGVQPALMADCPSVAVSALLGDGRGYAVLANHGPTPQMVTITARDALSGAERVTAAGPEPLGLLDAHRWQMRLDGHGGAVAAFTLLN